VAESQSRQNTTFPSGGGQAHGYLAVPSGGSGPGVVVIQEWWGLTDHIADVCDRLAGEGFVALAPDLYGGRTTHDADEAGELMMSLPVDDAARDLGGAVDFLLGHDAVTSSTVGAVGFCMGGGFVLRLAVPDSFRGLTAAVQGHYGLKDDFYPADDARAQEAQIREESGGQVEFHFYDAGHAFHNDTNKLGTYSETDARTAWSRTVDFLRTKVV
jgi:carboxymethylenebutenolidase